jgi:hypothetical protein
MSIEEAFWNLSQKNPADEERRKDKQIKKVPILIYLQLNILVAG